MADTERSINDLLTLLFQDGQVAGSITPQDLRDLIISVAPDFGGMYISTSVETVISTVDVAVKALGTTTVSPQVRGITMPVNNRLLHDDDATRQFMIEASFSITTVSNNIILGIGIAKNGVYDVTSEVRMKTGSSGSDIVMGSLSVHEELEGTDYIEVFLVNRTDNSNIELEYMSMNVTGYLE